MTRLPALTPKKVVAALLRAGFEKRRQRGSHLNLRHPLTGRRTLIPMHARDLHHGILKEIIKQAGLTEDEFRRLL